MSSENANNRPTTFTDEDLRRLKQDRLWHNNLEVHQDKIVQLINRLEAAEELIESAGDLKRSKAAREWLRTCGKVLAALRAKKF